MMTPSQYPKKKQYPLVQPWARVFAMISAVPSQGWSMQARVRNLKDVPRPELLAPDQVAASMLSASLQSTNPVFGQSARQQASNYPLIGDRSCSERTRHLPLPFQQGGLVVHIWVEQRATGCTRQQGLPPELQAAYRYW